MCSSLSCFCQLLPRVFFDTEINSLSPCCGQGFALETVGIQSYMYETHIWALGAKRRVKAKYDVVVPWKRRGRQEVLRDFRKHAMRMSHRKWCPSSGLCCSLSQPPTQTTTDMKNGKNLPLKMNARI
uniref:Uncharacterized protein n=1 Tax=Molossus molossus TaxID=27622 RepID=A0A7J8CZV4_MOLMO|nr:hypothetical protein HJG59_009537 [Molossus molossus]